jgi:hypothetical protein
MQPSTCKAGLIAIVACVATASGAAFSAPKAVRASYGVSMNGMAIGTVSEHFEADGATYRIVSETRPVGLAAFVQRQPLKFVSHGQVTREGLRPTHFEGRRTAADPPQVSAEFDWPNAQLVLKHNGKVESLPVSAGTQDRLSIMYHFMFMPIEKMRQVEFAMTNGRKLDRYRYRVTPDVELETAIGRVKTLHLVKLREPGDTTTEVWLSTQHQLLTVKMIIVERDGMRFDQVIQSLELRD